MTRQRVSSGDGQALTGEEVKLTKRLVGTTADQPDLADWGYGCGEQSPQGMPDGDLLCVTRTRIAGNTLGTCPLRKVTPSLTAARSPDNGYTRSRPEAIAPFSVTPHLHSLDNGTVAVA